MRSEVRTNRLFVNEEGRISGYRGLSIRVRFDLTETQDFVDGVPGLEFSFGNFRYKDIHAPQVNLHVLSGARVNLNGGGIQTAISLNGPDTFTVINNISPTQK